MSTNMYTLSLSNSMIISMKISVRKSLKCSQPNYHWGYTLETMHSWEITFCVQTLQVWGQLTNQKAQSRNDEIVISNKRLHWQ